MQLESGTMIEGKITGITKFGAFVDIGEGKTGMVHISEIASSYVKEISEHLSIGQSVKVKVLNVSEDGKISLSIKKAVEEQKPGSASYPASNNSTGDYSQKNNYNSNNKPPRRQNSSFSGSRKAAVPTQLSFEDMLTKFKQSSEDKMSDLKKSMEVRRAPRGSTKKGSSK